MEARVIGGRPLLYVLGRLRNTRRSVPEPSCRSTSTYELYRISETKSQIAFAATCAIET